MNAADVLARAFRFSMAASLMLASLTLAASDRARTLYVANNGTDNSLCGSRSTPCRSISQAMQNATDGEQIEVGPGLYGDIDDDGLLLSPGDENVLLPNSGYVIIVSKRLSIYSQAGASATVIRGPRDGAQGVTVEVDGNGARFGRVGGGFTIFGTDRFGNGLYVKGPNTHISGNVVIGHNSVGIVLEMNGNVTATGNTSVGNRIGFQVFSSSTAVEALLDHNVALDNREVGFDLQSPALHVLTNNRVSHNDIGIRLDGGTYYIRRNLVTGNNREGILSVRGNSAGGTSPDSVFTENTVSGNGYAGFRFAADAGGNNVRRNNIFGNGSSWASPSRNCGVRNESRVPVKAINNYWGAATGPGADPADNARGDCDAAGSQTIVMPFATQPIR